MRFSRTLHVVDAHAEGESGKVVIGGVGQVSGQTMFDKREENPAIPGITNTIFAGPIHRDRDEDGLDMIRSKNAVVVSPGRFDRSPCGTGTSARMAILHARGQLAPGQTFRHESPIGSFSDARIESTTWVSEYPAVVPSIAGRAWITSFNQLVLDPTDPFQHGFVVGRAWEPET
jgi:proline racemase